MRTKHFCGLRKTRWWWLDKERWRCVKKSSTTQWLWKKFSGKFKNSKMQSRLRSRKNIKSTSLRDQGPDQTRLTRDEAQTAAGTIAANKVKRNTTVNMSASSKKSPHLKVVVKQLSQLRLKMSWDRTWHCIVIVSVRLKKLNDSGKRIDKTPTKWLRLRRRKKPERW